jgi:hypothetical protein
VKRLNKRNRLNGLNKLNEPNKLKEPDKPNNCAALQGQIEFIKHHVALMAIEPSERGTLSYIGRFLSMQHLVDPFGGANLRLLRRGKELPVRVNPEPLGLSSGRRRARAFRPGSRRVDEYFPDGERPPIAVTF